MLDNVTRETPLQIKLVFDAFVLDCKSRNLSPATIKYYVEHVTYFFSHADNISTVEEITPTHIKSFMVWLQESGWSSNSVHTSSRAVKAFLNYCVRDEWIEKSPFERVKMPETDEKILPSFTVEDFQKISDACTSKRDRAIVYCLLDSGCRASEFLEWKFSDVNVMNGSVHVRHTKKRRERTVYLGNKARKELLRWLAELNPGVNDYLWQYQGSKTELQGNPLNPNGLTQMLKRIGKRANVSHCSPHTFRRTFCLWSLRNGMDIYTLQKISGIKSLEVLKRYLDLVESDLESAHKRYGPADNTL